MTNIHEKWQPEAIIADPLTTTDIEVAVQMDYRRDIIDEWKLPTRTLNDGFGDCEDLCILALKIWLNKFNLFGVLKIGQTSRGHHALAHLPEQGLYFDTRGRWKSTRIMKAAIDFKPLLDFRFHKPTLAYMTETKHA